VKRMRWRNGKDHYSRVAAFSVSAAVSVYSHQSPLCLSTPKPAQHQLVLLMLLLLLQLKHQLYSHADPHWQHTQQQCDFDLLTSQSAHTEQLPSTICLPSSVLIAQAIFQVDWVRPREPMQQFNKKTMQKQPRPTGQ